MITQSSTKTVTVIGSNDKPMSVDILRNKAGIAHSPTVIFCHGYKGFKDWGCWSLVADFFANKGFNFIKFNFSHNGVTPDSPMDFVDLEAFGNNNYCKELFDLKQVVNWVSESDQNKDFFGSSPLYLLGHSRGGGIVSLAAARDFRIARAATWASVCDLTTRLPKNSEEWQEKGVIHQLNGRTNQEMPLYYQFYENTQMNKEALSIAQQGKKIKIPFLVIHGANDTAVPYEEATELHEFIPTSELIIHEKTGHTFGSSHPWDSEKLPNELEEIVIETIQFFGN